jgi:hypothetical protein
VRDTSSILSEDQPLRASPIALFASRSVSRDTVHHAPITAVLIVTLRDRNHQKRQ